MSTSLPQVGLKALVAAASLALPIGFISGPAALAAELDSDDAVVELVAPESSESATDVNDMDVVDEPADIAEVEGAEAPAEEAIVADEAPVEVEAVEAELPPVEVAALAAALPTAEPANIPVAAAAVPYRAGVGGTPRFVDVPKGHKFYKAITWMRVDGLSTGTTVRGGKAYKPGDRLTREAMAAFLYRVEGAPQFTMPRQGFIDVPPNHKFYRPIMWMKAKGLTTGIKTPQGLKFGASERLTREAMAAFLYRMEGSPRGVGSSTYPDVQRGHKFYQAIAWMKATKLTTGINRNGRIEFGPSDPLSREAMAAFLFRMNGSPTFVDSGSVRVTGTPKSGAVVQAAVAGWQPTSVNFTYQWYRNGARIADAKSASYTLTDADAGKAIQVGVTGSVQGASSITMTSNSVGFPATTTAPPVKTGASTAALREAFRTRMAELLNAERAQRGLPPVVLEARFAPGADAWIEQVASSTPVHTTQDYWVQRGFTSADGPFSENLAFSALSTSTAFSALDLPDARVAAEYAFVAWLGHPPHRDIMLKPFPAKVWSTVQFKQSSSGREVEFWSSLNVIPNYDA